MIDFRKVGEAAVEEYDSIRRNWVRSKADFKKEQEQIGRAAVAAMIPPYDEQGRCDEMCPFFHFDNVDSELTLRGCTLNWSVEDSPGPDCPARREA